MKSTRRSFLFFFVLVTSVFCANNHLNSQNVADSTGYYYDLAMKPKKTDDFLLAYDFFTRQKELCLNKNNINGVIYNLGFIAIIQNEFGFYYDSETSSIEGLALLDELEENQFVKDSKVTFYNQLGKANRALNNFDLALLYYDKALELTESPKHLNKIINNRAFVYIDRNQYEKALTEIERAYKLSLTSGDDFDIARNLDNLGFIKSKLNHKDALAIMDSALSKRLKLKDYQGTFASYNHLSEYYNSIGNNQMAESSIKQALQIAEKINSDAYKLEALSDLMLFNDDENVKYFKELNDKVNLERLKKESKYASRKYHYQKEEARAKANELKYEKEKSNKIIAISTASFILLLAFFLYYFLRIKHKKEKLQQVYNTETRISKKIHDEVANDIFQVMTKLENDGHITEDQINDMQHLYHRTRDISKEHSVVQSTYPFKDVLSDLIESFNDANTNVIIKGISEIPWTSIPEINRTTIYKVLQELLINMKKHSQASLVVLIFEKNKKTISITYSDNGVGTILKKGTGLQNTENRIQSINGTITFETNPDKGFKVKISV